jgi:hypothetical protein
MNKKMISKEVIMKDGKHYVEEKYWSLFPSDRIITMRRRKLFSIPTILDLLPKWTSIVVWIGILIYLLSTGMLKAQSLYPSTQVEIVGYRIVMSDDMGCWSELQIINENRFIDEKTKKLIIDKIAKYELYGMSGGESPMLEVKEKSGRISYYHLVKLPSDTWRID